jgi:nucleotide-binding universal stress UspA family protein
VLKTILVALDDSDLSDQVVQMVLELPLTTNVKVVLCRVIARTEADPDVVADRPHEAQDLSYRQIEKRLQAYQGQFACVTELEIVTGDPAEEIIRLSNIYQADLIAIGSRGLTGLNRILQGSVSSQVVADAPCSVLVVKPRS